MSENASGQLSIITSREDFADFLRKPKANRGVAALLGIEGTEALDGDITAIERLNSAGFRVFGLVHQTDNDAAGSSQGIAKSGVTAQGRQVLAELARLGVILDLAHASNETINDTLANGLPRPPIVSHTGVEAVCAVPRNLRDAELTKLVAAGGIVGIGYWDNVLCLQTGATAAMFADKIAASIQHVVAVTQQVNPNEAYDHVALGSDFDGWVKEGLDSTGTPLITDALLRAGLTDDQIRKILGGNYCRYLLTYLPTRTNISLSALEVETLCNGT